VTTPAVKIEVVGAARPVVHTAVFGGGLGLIERHVGGPPPIGLSTTFEHVLVTEAFQTMDAHRRKTQSITGGKEYEHGWRLRCDPGGRLHSPALLCVGNEMANAAPLHSLDPGDAYIHSHPAGTRVEPSVPDLQHAQALAAWGIGFGIIEFDPIAPKLLLVIPPGKPLPRPLRAFRALWRPLIVTLRHAGTIRRSGSHIVAVGDWGIELKLVPGPLGLGFGIELRRGTSSGALTLLDTLSPEQVQGREITYRDKLPPTGTTYFYDARLIGKGFDPGPYCQEASATAGFLPRLVNGTEPGEAVLGQPLPPIYVSAESFVPTLDSTAFNISGGLLTPGAINTTASFYCSVRLPSGAVIAELAARGKRANAGDSCVVALQEIDDSPSLSSVHVFTFSAAVGWQTMTDNPAYTVRADRRYAVLVTLKGVSAVIDGAFQWLRITLVANSYAQIGTG
jgi:hypothetical protein